MSYNNSLDHDKKKKLDKLTEKLLKKKGRNYLEKDALA